MSVIDFKKTAEYVLKTILKTPIKERINLINICDNALCKKYPELSLYERTDVIDKLLNKLKSLLMKRIEYCESQKIAPEYIFSTYPDIIINYSKKHRESDLIASLRMQKKKIIQAIGKKMNWESFERLCRYILGNNNIRPLHITKANKEGIDFCGLFDMDEFLGSDFIPKDCKIRVVGQAKHYSTKIPPTLVRTFYTYCEDVQDNKIDVLKDLPDWFKRRDTPVIGIFMTTSLYTRRAIIFARNKWLILKNGEQIAEFIIKSPNSKKWVLEKVKHLDFDSKAFLNSFSK